ncbi:MAG: DUF1127 domain-containing protein [Nitratireductor sp.]|nr:DUF1127 domain-containing protein [Nitratireductor sp.]
MTMMQHHTKMNGVSPILLNFLSASIGFLVDENEINQAVSNHMDEIMRLNRMSDRELSAMGITRDQITAYVLHEAVEI